MTEKAEKHPIPASGFTLIEILIAIFILGLVLATVYASYSSTLKITRELEDDSAIYKMARTSLDRMMRDLSSLQLSGDSFDLHAEKNMLGNQVFHSVYFWSAAHLVFNENEVSGSPSAIAYFVQEDEGNESFSLWRSDIAGAKPPKEKKPGGGMVICQNIESISFKFYDAGGREYDSWDTSSSDTQQKGKAPATIKIELSLANPREKDKPYRFMTKIFLTAK